MTNHEPRRHHYIPQVLLRNFLDDCDCLWVGNRYQKRIYKTSPKNVFVKKDLYAVHDFAQATRTYCYEKSFSKMEGEVAPVIKKIIEQARNRKCPQLSPDECRIWKQFFIAIARRTPESQKRVSADGNRDVFYEALKSRADELNFDLCDQDTLYKDSRIPEIKKKVESNVNAKFSIGISDKERKQTEQFSRETGVSVVVIFNPKRSFVIGSHGFSIVKTSDRNDPAQGGWLPIASDVAVKATTFPDKEILNFLKKDRTSDRFISRINKAAYSHSNLIAGRSKTLINSLMHR